MVFVGLYYYGVRVSVATHIIKAVTDCRCDRSDCRKSQSEMLAFTLICVIINIVMKDTENKKIRKTSIEPNFCAKA